MTKTLEPLGMPFLLAERKGYEFVCVCALHILFHYQTLFWHILIYYMYCYDAPSSTWNVSFSSQGGVCDIVTAVRVIVPIRRFVPTLFFAHFRAFRGWSSVWFPSWRHEDILKPNLKPNLRKSGFVINKRISECETLASGLFTCCCLSRPTKKHKR